MRKTHGTMQPTNEVVLASMPRTTAISSAYSDSLSWRQRAATTVLKLAPQMNSPIATHSDIFDSIIPAFLLLGVLAAFIIIFGSSGSRETTSRRVRPRGSYPRHKESTPPRFNKLFVYRARTRMPLPELPTEVVEHIIDYLHDNHFALAACKLVHRTWLPRARMHLHRTLIFEQGGIDPFKLRYFPQVAQHARELIVAHHLLREVSSSILMELDKIESLQVVMTPAMNTSYVRLLSASKFPHFSHLKELYISGSSFSTQRQALLSMAKSPSINSLTVDISPPHYRWEAPRLTMEEIRELSPKSSPFKLETLHFRYFWNTIAPFGAFSQNILDLTGGESLKHLTLTHLRHGSLETIFLHQILDLSKHTSLETVSTVYDWEPSPRHIGDDHAADGLRSFLFQLRHANLRVISFRITILAPRTHLLENLRDFCLGWLNGIVRPSQPGGSEDEEMNALVEKLESVEVELSFSDKLTANDVNTVRSHFLAQLMSLTERELLKLTLKV